MIVGWFMIGLIFFNVLINFLLLLKGTIGMVSKLIQSLWSKIRNRRFNKVKTISPEKETYT